MQDSRVRVKYKDFDFQFEILGNIVFMRVATLWTSIMFEQMLIHYTNNYYGVSGVMWQNKFITIRLLVLLLLFVIRGIDSFYSIPIRKVAARKRWWRHSLLFKSVFGVLTPTNILLLMHIRSVTRPLFTLWVS